MTFVYLLEIAFKIIYKRLINIFFTKLIYINVKSLLTYKKLIYSSFFNFFSKLPLTINFKKNVKCFFASIF